ncbi:rRNA maturation RNase YbeY [Flavobacteriales bacterium]|nr:rRNA maturation RNase YbeY [Flavobacteriales bacterium]
MIDFVYNTDFRLANKEIFTRWLISVANDEGYLIDTLVFLFVDDKEILEMNKKFLKHDYYTDVITFGELEDKKISGDIAISIERVLDNSKTYGVEFEDELKRVMVHGLLHIMGYNDKASDDKSVMSQKENKAMKMFHVKQV